MKNAIRRSLEQQFTAAEGYKLIGYVNKYGTESQIMYDDNGVRFIETIERGAFTKSIADPKNDIKADFNHNHDKILGRQSKQTLKLVEDEVGLRAEIQLNPNDPEHVSVYEKAKPERQDIIGMSFEFYPYEQDERKISSKLVKRNVKRAGLFYVSPVTDPAYLTSTIETRNTDSMDTATIQDVKEAFESLSEDDKLTLAAELLKPTPDEKAKLDKANEELNKQQKALENIAAQAGEAPEQAEEKTEQAEEESELELANQLIERLKALLEADSAD